MSGVLNGRVLYVAEPIDQSDMGSWKGSVARMMKLATDRGWIVYRPAGAWKVGDGAPVGHEIESVNRAVLRNCRAVVAFLPAGVPTVGVPREVEWAVANTVPVVAVSDLTSAWSLSDVPRIELDDVPTFGSWLVAVENTPPASQSAVAFMLRSGGRLPAKSNAGDAGFDLFVSEDTHVGGHEFVDVPCAIQVALPTGVWARITGRSSTLRKRNLLVAEGIIDNGYRGLLYSGVYNLGVDTAVVRKGERIAQLILHTNTSSEYVPVEVDIGLFDRIPGDSRGEAGFGSTGV